MKSMEICVGRQVWAPSVWVRDHEVYDATVRLGEPPPAAALALAAARIDAALPRRHRLFGGFVPTDVAADAASGLDRARLLGQTALALQAESRLQPTTFLEVTNAGEPGLFRIVLESLDPVLAQACLREAATLLDRGIADDLPSLTPLVDRLTVLADDVCVGPGTMLIVRAAAARGIPWRRLGLGCMVQLGQGVRQRRIWTAVTDRTSSIAEGIAIDKQLTKDVLAAAGVPTPLGRVVASADEAWQAAQEVGRPVVVKPADGNHGRGVFLNLSTREEIVRAFPVASAKGRREKTVVVERFVPGVEHRLLVIGGRMVACAKGEHLYVTGDGRRTIAELIDLQINSDPRRGRSEAMPNKTVDLDATVLAQLAQEGVLPTTVPADGRRVLVKRIGTHGLDVTADVHPEMAATAVRAARAVGLDIAGIDLIAQDISQPPRPQGAAVCEVNAGPQLMIHTHPSQGPGRPVAEAIVAELFGAGETGRIPIAAVMGRLGSATAITLGRLLRAAGHTPGLTCTDGKWVADTSCSAESHATVDAARDLLVSPEIDAAVVELDWRSVAGRGLPLDRFDALVLLPLPEAALPVVEAMILAVAETGTIVVTDATEAAVRDRAAGSGRRVITTTSAETAAAAAATALIGSRGNSENLQDRAAATFAAPEADATPKSDAI